MKNRHLYLLMAAAVLAGGCFGGKAVQRRALARRRTFVPETGQEVRAEAGGPCFAAAKIRAFRVLPPFDARSFIVRRAGGEYAADFYNCWLAPPQALISTQAARYLAETRVFKAVYDAGAGTLAPLGIEGVVSGLYLDYAGDVPAAVVRLRLLVLDERSPRFRVLFDAEREAREAFDAAKENAAAEAFGAALTKTLEGLAADLRAADLPRPDAAYSP
ncbi:MAG: hypothetical protein PHE10_01090 [Kiritimatiellae bacterium]|nr:hypothetical protein [Kiritimatiellia bacterium]